jgi:hypothetical protein
MWAFFHSENLVEADGLHEIKPTTHRATTALFDSADAGVGRHHMTEAQLTNQKTGWKQPDVLVLNSSDRGHPRMNKLNCDLPPN